MKKPYWSPFGDEFDRADIDQIRYVIDEVIDAVETLQKIAHPPLGQDRIYDRLEELEKEMRSLRQKSSRSAG